MELKNNFVIIIEIKKNVKIIFDILQQKINKLRELYHDFIINNNTQILIFGLDSFYFQNKMIDIEYNDMKNIFLAMNNRIYCEYYKLYRIIISYIKDNIKDKKLIEMIKIKDYPIYKDLEPYKEYDFELISDIHENIFDLITHIINYIEHKEKDLINHTSKKNIGLNIDNFVSTFNYDIIILKEKVKLFIKYIEFFHKLHLKHYKRFNNKIQLMYNDICSDINFDEQIITEDKLISIKNDRKIYDQDCSLDSKDSLVNSKDSQDSSYNSPDEQTKNKDLKQIFKKNVRKVSTILKLKNISNEIKSENVDLNNVCDSINNVCNNLISDSNELNKLNELNELNNSNINIDISENNNNINSYF